MGLAQLRPGQSVDVIAVTAGPVQRRDRPAAHPRIPVSRLSRQRTTNNGTRSGGAAELCGALHPHYAVPIHYAFWGNALTERLVIKHSRTGATDFQAAARRLSPQTTVCILSPGEPPSIAQITRPQPQVAQRG